MIDLRGIRYSIAGKALLQGVDLRLNPGEIVALVGANGAGKTTLLKILSGATAPDSGQATLDGKPIHAYGAQRLARRRAVLPQFSSLTFGFSALEVVMLGRTPHPTSAAENVEISFQAMIAAGVDHLAQRSYPTLSGGEQQRVHLARALAQIWTPTEHGDRYLLLDEPTASLDLSHQHQVLRIARDCAKAGIGVLAVLHDLNLASQHADRIAVMRKGCVMADGCPDDVMTPDIIYGAFDISVMVTRHPCAACPLIVAVPEGGTVPVPPEDADLDATIRSLTT
jgi:iron complex transport system ATP-binding protein